MASLPGSINLHLVAYILDIFVNIVTKMETNVYVEDLANYPVTV